MPGGNVLHYVNRERGNCPAGELSGENMSEGEMSRGKCPTLYNLPC